MSQSLSHLFQLPQPRWTDRLALAARRAVAAWRQAATQRSLAGLDERTLKDLGLSQAQAGFVAERPLLGGLAGNLR